MEKFDLNEDQNKIVNMLLDDCICENIKVFVVYFHKFILKSIKDLDNPTKEEKVRMIHTFLILTEMFDLSEDQVDETMMKRIRVCMDDYEEGLVELRNLYAKE